MRPLDDGYEVIQIKSHTRSLTSGQKAKIEKSLQVVCDPELDRPVRAWRLLIPLDRTKEADRWWNDLVSAAPFECSWWGLSDHVEPLAASEPHVVDWYFRDGRVRLEARLRDLQHAASLLDQPIAPLRPAEAWAPIAALNEAINRHDPHYRYYIEVSPTPPTLDDERERPNILLAVSRSLPNGDYLTTRVYAKHPHATEEAPVPISFALALDPDDTGLRRQVEDAFSFGSSVTLPEGAVRDLRIGAPGGLDHRSSAASLRISGLDDEDFVPFRLRLRVTDANNGMVAETVVEADRRTRGFRGYDVHLAELAETFKITLRLDLSAETPALFVRDMTLGEPDQHAARILPAYEVLYAMRSPHKLHLLPEHSDKELAWFEVQDTEPPVDETYLQVLRALARLQPRTLVPLRTPETVEAKEYAELRRLDRLLNEGSVAGTWTVRIGVAARDIDRWLNEVLSGPGLAVEQPLRLDLDGQHVDFNQRYTLKLLSARVVDADEMRRSAAFSPPDAEIVVVLVPDEHNRYEAYLGDLTDPA
ncbi:MAG TPA: hypothetical protein VK988_18410 [Acidimicrobiales bacterium]|nr:hypothetical protein [Acidimicrobiales bacterium]